MKILHVISSISSVRGGPGPAALGIVKTLRNCGINAEIATTNDNGRSLLKVPLSGRSEYDGVPVWFFPRLWIPVAFLREYVFSIPFGKWLWQNVTQYDIVHIHVIFSYTAAIAMLLCRIRNIPYIVRPNGMLCKWSLRQGGLHKRVYLKMIGLININHSRAVEFTSKQEKEESIAIGIKTKNIIIPYGLFLPETLPHARENLREKLKIPKEMPIVLFMSRLHYKKGLQCLIPALGAVKNEKFSFVIAGESCPRYEKTVETMLKKAGVLGFTIRTGFAQGRIKKLLLQGSDIFALTSYSESFGLAALEAMANGLAVVISRNVPLWREVEKHKTGIVTDCDPEEISRAISELLKNEKIRKTMGENGKRLAKTLFGWDKIAGKTITLYKNILNQ